MYKRLFECSMNLFIFMEIFSLSANEDVSRAQLFIFLWKAFCECLENMLNFVAGNVFDWSGLSSKEESEPRLQCFSHNMLPGLELTSGFNSVKQCHKLYT